MQARSVQPQTLSGVSPQGRSHLLKEKTQNEQREKTGHDGNKNQQKTEGMTGGMVAKRGRASRKQGRKRNEFLRVC